MAHKNLGNSDRSALSFRPKIEFVEPEFTGPMPSGKTSDTESVEEVSDKWDELDRVARAASLLAQAVQIQIDQNSGDFYIGLDPNHDRHVMDALRRRFPDSPTDRVSYDQYRECRTALAERAQGFAAGVMPSSDQIKETRKNPMDENAAIGFDLNSIEAKTGMLRPELIAENMPVQQLDMDEVQSNLLLSLMNKLWADFLRPPLAAIPLLGEALPESFGEEDESNQPPEI